MERKLNPSITMKRISTLLSIKTLIVKFLKTAKTLSQTKMRTLQKVRIAKKTKKARRAMMNLSWTMKKIFSLKSEDLWCKEVKCTKK